MQMDDSRMQFVNAESSMCKSPESGSNAKFDRLSQPEKQPRQRVSTEAGMQIDDSDEQYQNAEVSMEESFEPDSNTTVDNSLQPEKQR
jgi:hypothetical protein